MTEHADKRLERLIFFSDAVIAIAITLLVIEIKIPHFERNDPAVALNVLRDLLPSFFGFALSFLVIGRFWNGHAAALVSMTKYDPRLSRPNLFFLMSIALMPFATGFMAHNIGQLVPTLFYNATLLITALLCLWVVRIATDSSSDCSAHEAEDAKTMRNRATIAVAASCVVVALTFLVPDYSQVPFVPLLIWERFRSVRQGKLTQ